MKNTFLFLYSILIILSLYSCDNKDPEPTVPPCLLAVDIDVIDVDANTKTLAPVPSGGTGNYDFTWNGAYTTSTITISRTGGAHGPGWYKLRAKDRTSYCTAYDSIEVTFPPMIPTAMIINSVDVNCFPVDDNGTPWDSDGTPADLRLSINMADANNISEPPVTTQFYTSQIFSNQSSSPFSFTNDFPYTINKPDTSYNVTLWNDNSPSAPTVLRSGIRVNFFNWASPTFTDTLRVSVGTNGCSYPNLMFNITWVY